MHEIMPTSDVVCLVADYGYFSNLAEKLAESFKKVYYYSPVETEFRFVGDAMIGEGLDNVERLDDWIDPKHLPGIDLFVFPDIGMAPLQKHLLSLGKVVWGSRDASKIEYSRTLFLDMIKSVGLPYAPYETVTGLSALSEHLKRVKNKWVKINKFRGNMETFFHLDYEHTARKLEKLALDFGGAKEFPVFVVQDHIETEIETGYDGWCVDGEFPEEGFCGYELKNQAYLAALTKYEDLPKAVKDVNAAIAPILKKVGYRNFFSTEIRIKDEVPYFIDPTVRAAGLAMEQQQESLTNIAEVIWRGANGELIKPEYNSRFVAESTLHYDGDVEAWKILRVPKDKRAFIKADHYCVINDDYHYPISKSDELGVVMGLGDTAQEAIDHLKENFKAIEDEFASIDIIALAELLQKAQDGKEHGVNFSDAPIPEPEEVVS